ncbi:MAG TPA: hypothetical protein VKB95_10960 [Chitinophagaceae bacterium]|nr:hypothetical protein [Chitinophagaceae bacterium]
MIIVNPIFIHEVVSPLIGGADSEETIDICAHYRPDVEKDVKQLSRDILLPAFKKQKEVLQQAVKNTLAYYLTYPQKVNFESIFNSLLLSINTPTDARLFFQWIWEVFYDGESRDYIKNEIVIENFDINATINLLITK